MDPNSQSNPGQPEYKPSAPSLDGFLKTTNQAAQPKHRSVPAPSSATSQAGISSNNTLPGRSPTASPAVPSHAKRPFQPAEFFKPPTLPALPKIEDTPTKAAEMPKPPQQGLRDILSVMGVLASALLLAFCLINFVFQSYQVEGPSMRTTLQNSDHLIVWKVGKTIANITGQQYVPHRGDIIIFNEPANAEAGGRPGKQLIKRVIGLPGDRVVYDNTDVIIYNKQYPNGFHPDKEMPYGSKIINEKPSNVDVTLDTDEIFVSGDNRDNSLDSRIFGPLKLDKVVGKLVVRILPLNTFKLF